MHTMLLVAHRQRTQDTPNGMTRRGWFRFIGAAFLAVTPLAQAQKASSWRVYRLADGLPESACLSVTVSPQGKVVAKHLNLPSLSKLDGYGVTAFPAPQDCQGRIYESAGGQMWTVNREGLQEFRDGAWLRQPVPEIAAAF